MKQSKYLISGIFSIMILGSLSSCGLAKSAAQLPIRTLQSAQRSVGIQLQATEVQDVQEPIEFRVIKE